MANTIADNHAEEVATKVINISSKTFSQEQVSILEKGLKFTPTPKHANISEIKKDIAEFSRRVRLAETFFDMNEDDSSLARNKSRFIPKKGKNLALDTFCDNISNFPLEAKTTDTNNRTNFSKHQWKILEELKNDESIIIKEADKGSAIVIMNKTDYKDMVMDIISDAGYYQHASDYKSQMVMKKLNQLVNIHRKCLTDKETDYLTNFECKTSNFYGLPKVHKSDTIKKMCEETKLPYIEMMKPDNLKLRPIVAGPANETHRLSSFLDLLLKPFLKHIPSYIRDDIDFLQHLPQSVEEDTVLVTLDVVGLYSNIPHDFGIKALEYWIDKHPEELPDRVSKEFILESMTFILNNNYFLFNNKSYKQIKGTAMGTKVAPTYANLVMGYLENLIDEKVAVAYPDMHTANFVQNWKRYLDDCWFLFRKRWGNLKEFHELLNNIHADFQFTVESSENKIPFLDILIIKRENLQIETDMYFKTTDTKQYLFFYSSHPKHTIRNIPYNLARRICTIVSNTTTRDARLKELKFHLKQRRYPEKLIDFGIEKARRQNQVELREPKVHTDDKIIPLVTTYNPRNPRAFNIIKNNIPILEQDHKMKKVLETSPIINSQRQPKTLKRILTKAKFEDKSSEDTRITKCGRSNCGTCPFLIEGSSYEFKNGFMFNIKSPMNCASNNLLYVIRCLGCGEDYIGQTGTELRKRVTVHKQQIRDPSVRMIPLSGHIANCAANKIIGFSIYPFYKFRSDTTENERVTKEKEFIRKYNPKLNAH